MSLKVNTFTLFFKRPKFLPCLPCSLQNRCPLCSWWRTLNPHSSLSDPSRFRWLGLWYQHKEHLPTQVHPENNRNGLFLPLTHVKRRFSDRLGGGVYTPVQTPPVQVTCCDAHPPAQCKLGYIPRPISRQTPAKTFPSFNFEPCNQFRLIEEQPRSSFA